MGDVDRELGTGDSGLPAPGARPSRERMRRSGLGRGGEKRSPGFQLCGRALFVVIAGTELEETREDERECRGEKETAGSTEIVGTGECGVPGSTSGGGDTDRRVGELTELATASLPKDGSGSFESAGAACP